MIAGHYDYLQNGLPFNFQERVYGLDTSRVHGGRLTGLLLPEFKIVSVASRRNYWSETMQRYARAKSSTQVSTPRQPLPDGWDETSEHIRVQIVGLAQAESQRILAELRDAPGFSESTPRLQTKAYAAAISSDVPWLALLNQARIGKVKLDVARQRRETS